ncbi:MAG TPA: hypothetical protein PLN86_02830 [Candidatus Hydrogenedentes bacterium]|nr:hypothetical protein [Candidatus Hydrogenedentota bacterium]
MEQKTLRKGHQRKDTDAWHFRRTFELSTNPFDHLELLVFPYYVLFRYGPPPVIARSPEGATWQSAQMVWKARKFVRRPLALYATAVIARSAVRHDVAIPSGFRGSPCPSFSCAAQLRGIVSSLRGLAPRNDNRAYEPGLFPRCSAKGS